MFIRNTVTFRPSTFSAKNRWSITFPWWQVYRTTGFRCYVFPLLICWDLSSRTDACADVKYTHTHTHTHIYIYMNTNNDTHTSWKCICISNDNLNTGPLCYGGEGMRGENNWFPIRPTTKENFMPHHQNDGQNYSTKLRYISSENRAVSRHYETALQDS